MSTPKEDVRLRKLGLAVRVSSAPFVFLAFALGCHTPASPAQTLARDASSGPDQCESWFNLCHDLVELDTATRCYDHRTHCQQECSLDGGVEENCRACMEPYMAQCRLLRDETVERCRVLRARCDEAVSSARTGDAAAVTK
jgi:hypothetical protein